MAGSSVDREIRLTATDNGVADKLTRIKESTLALGRGIVEDAKSRATNQRELNKLINEEIAALERRNKLDSQSRELSAREKYKPGSKELSTELQKIAIENKEDKVQSDFLKQILQAILQTSQREISEDRLGVQRRISSDRELDTMDDHEEAIKQTFQRRMLEDEPLGEEKLPEEEKKKRRDSRFASMGNFIQDTDLYTIGYGAAGNFMSSRAASVENKLGKRALLIGGTLAGAVGMGISEASEKQEGIGDLSRAGIVEARSISSSLDKGLDMTTAEASKRAAQLVLESKGTITDPGELRNILAYQRRFGISGSSLAGMSAYTTPYEGGINVTQLFGMMKNLMEQQNMHQAKTNDLLQLGNEVTQREFLSSGEGDAYRTTQIINRVLSGQEVKSVERARQTIGQLEGVVSNSSEQMEAVKFSLFQQKTGGSYVDYLREKSKGVGGEIDDLIINSIIKGGGSRDQKALSLVGLGMDITTADDIIRAGGVSPLDVTDKRGKSTWSRNLQTGREASEIQSTEAFNQILSSSAFVSNAFSMVGDAAVSLASNLGKLVPGYQVKEDKSTRNRTNRTSGGITPDGE